MLRLYARNDRLRITDPDQGNIRTTHTGQTRRQPQLITRFAHDGDHGTVLKRLPVRVVIGYPPTVHGTGGQIRAATDMRASVCCIELAQADATVSENRLRISDQVTRTHRMRDLLAEVAQLTGCAARVPRPVSALSTGRLEQSG